MPYKYKYFVKFNDDDEKKEFGKLDDLCNYLNDYFNLEIYSRDNMINYFYKRTKKINPIFEGFELLHRIRI